MKAPPAGHQAFEPARFAWGDTMHHARRMRLIEMEPREDFCSHSPRTGEPGRRELRPGAHPNGGFTVTLEPRTYSVEWCGIDDREAF